MSMAVRRAIVVVRELRDEAMKYQKQAQAARSAGGAEYLMKRSRGISARADALEQECYR